MALAAELARVADVKRWLEMSGDEDDVLLERLIAQTSRAILGYLGRPSVLPTRYREYFEGRGQSFILLRQWPIISVESCMINSTSVPRWFENTAEYGLAYIVDEIEQFPPGRMQGLRLSRSCFPLGIRNISISYFAGYQITNESAIVPLAEPFDVFVEQPHGYFAHDVTVTDAIGNEFLKVETDPGAGEYSCADGVYRFSGSDAGKAVQLSYGYVPHDLSRCCVEWTAEQYQYRMRIGQHSKSLGGHENVSFIVKDMPDFVRSVLQPYRRVITP